MEGVAALRNLLPANTVLLTPLPIERRLITTDEPPTKTSSSRNRGVVAPSGGNNITAPQRRREQVFLSMFVLDGVDRLAGGRLIILPPLTYDEEHTVDFNEPFERDEESTESQSQSQSSSHHHAEDGMAHVSQQQDRTDKLEESSASTTKTATTAVMNTPGRNVSTLLMELGKHSPTRFIHTLYAALGIIALEDLRRRTIEEYDSHLRDSLASFHRWSCNFKAPQLLVQDIEKERLLQSFTLLDQHERTGIFQADVEVRRVWLKPYAALLGDCARGWVAISKGEVSERELLLITLGDPSKPTPCCESRCRFGISQEEEVQRRQIYGHGQGLVKTTSTITSSDGKASLPYQQHPSAEKDRAVASSGTVSEIGNDGIPAKGGNVALELFTRYKK
jgi:hypothetical protein